MLVLLSTTPCPRKRETHRLTKIAVKYNRYEEPRTHISLKLLRCSGHPIFVKSILVSFDDLVS